MRKVVCSVFDNVAGVYSNPFYSVNIAVASRDFARACTEPSSSLAVHPQDYSLYQLAEFDDSSGVFVSCQPPVFICSAASVLNPTDGE